MRINILIIRCGLDLIDDWLYFLKEGFTKIYSINSILCVDISKRGLFFKSYGKYGDFIKEIEK